MPASNTVQLPEPKNWQEFQEMSVALFTEEWGDPNTKENGRSGQRQNGVDVYGQRDGKWCGIQCKGRRRWPPNPLKIAELDHEAAEARSFVPPLTEFTIATTAADDAKLQTRARELTDENQKLGLFSVHVVGWGDFERRLCRHDRLLAEFYGFLGYGHETGLKDHVTSEKDNLKAYVQDGLAALSAQMRAQVSQPGAQTGPDALATRGDIERLMDVFLASQGSNAIQKTMPPDTLSADKRSEDPGLPRGRVARHSRRCLRVHSCRRPVARLPDVLGRWLVRDPGIARLARACPHPVGNRRTPVNYADRRDMSLVKHLAALAPPEAKG